jgi:hypothetical protein
MTPSARHALSTAGEFDGHGVIIPRFGYLDLDANHELGSKTRAW